MSLADVVRFQVVTASLVDSHLAGLTTVPLTSKTPDTIFTLVTIRHLGGGRGDKWRRKGGGRGHKGWKEEGGHRRERKEGRRREGGRNKRGWEWWNKGPSNSQFISTVKHKPEISWRQMHVR